jgi:hypothetical protein
VPASRMMRKKLIYPAFGPYGGKFRDAPHKRLARQAMKLNIKFCLGVNEFRSRNIRSRNNRNLQKLK